MYSDPCRATSDYPITRLLNYPISEGFRRQDDRIAEAERGQVGADGVEIADDERRQAVGIQVMGRDAGDVGRR